MAKKIIKKNEVVKAVRKFTDRTQPRKSFFDKYEKLKESFANIEDIYIINYYGVGGIGKSTLMRKLQAELQEKEKKPYFVYYDFETSSDMKTALRLIKTKLEQNYKFSFPLFDIAYYVYSKKTGENISKKEIESLIEKSRTLSFIVDSAEEIPIIGIASKLVRLADSGIAVLRNLTSQHKNELNQIEKDSPEEIYYNLPYYFSLDLEENIKKIKQPLVMFLDTYERLVNEITGTGHTISQDLWLRDEKGPILNVPGVLWVIAGREKIKWGEIDNDWQDTLEQHILGDLAFTDANLFLEEAGIDDAVLRQDIYNLTHGTPLYLDICVSTYEILKVENKPITIKDFGKNIDVLIERYIRYMDHQSREMTYVLANISLWDDEMVHIIGPKILPNFSYVLYEKIKNLSFVNTCENNYYIHKTVRDVFMATSPKIIKEKTVNVLYEYYFNFLTTESTINTKFSSCLKGYLTISKEYINENNTSQVLKDFVFVSNILEDASLNDEHYIFSKDIYENLEKKYKMAEYGYLIKYIYANSLAINQEKEQALILLEQVWRQIKNKEIDDYFIKVVDLLGLLYQSVYPNNKIINEVLAKLKTANIDNPDICYALGYYSSLIHDDVASMFYFNRLLDNDNLDDIDKLTVLVLIFTSIPTPVLQKTPGFDKKIEKWEEKFKTLTDLHTDLISFNFALGAYYALNDFKLDKAIYYLNQAEKLYNEKNNDINNLFYTIVILKLDTLLKLKSLEISTYASQIYEKIKDVDSSITLERYLCMLRILSILAKLDELQQMYKEVFKTYENEPAALNLIALFAVNNGDYDIAKMVLTKVLDLVKQDSITYLGLYEDVVLKYMPLFYPNDELEKHINDFYQDYKELVNDEDLILPILRRIIKVHFNKQMNASKYIDEFLNLTKNSKNTLEYANTAYEIASYYQESKPEYSLNFIEEALKVYQNLKDGADWLKESLLLKGKLLLILNKEEGEVILSDLFSENKENNLGFAAKVMETFLEFSSASLKIVDMALELSKLYVEIYGEESQENINVLVILGKKYWMIGNKDKAKIYFEKAVSIAEKLYGEKNSDYLDLLDRIICFLFENEEYNLIYKYGEKMCALLDKIPAIPLSFYVNHLWYYGSALAYLKEYEKLTKVIDKLKALEKANENMSVKIFDFIVKLYSKVQKYEDIFNYALEVLEKYKQRGENEKNINTILSEISYARHMLKKYDQSLYDMDQNLLHYYKKVNDENKIKEFQARLDLDKKNM